MSALIQALRDPRCYPHPVEAVRLIETHISWLLLTGRYAYKIKKPLRLDFLDFSTLERRRHYCLEELRLNRRYAPKIYLNVVPIAGTPAAPRVDAVGEVLEYALRMHEFDQDCLFDRRLDAGTLSARDIDALGDTCARLHAQAAAAEAEWPFGTPESLLPPALDNFTTIERLLPDAQPRADIAALRAWTEAEHARLRPEFAARKRGGHVRECHGDLHLGNIALLDGEPVPFDCIEFNEAFRWIDVVNEIAFTVMDLHARGRPDFGRRLLNRYLEAGGDYDGVRVLRFYLVYRAAVRAKIDCIRAAQTPAAAQGEAQWRDFERRIALARSFVERRAAFLAVTCGLSGSGKTHATTLALERTDALRIRSDVERKRLAGLAADARSGAGLDTGLYSADASERTFERLAQLAATIVAAGYPAIVDATFIERRRRERFRALAAQLGVPFLVLHFRASQEVLAARIVQRQQAADDASEADLEVLNAQIARQQPVHPAECDELIEVDTEDPASIAAMVERLAQLAGGEA